MNRHPRKQLTAPTKVHSKYNGILNLIWAYFFLLIFEGALRKWIMPGLADATLIIRDPIVIMIYIMAIQQKVFPMNNYIVVAGLLAVISFAFTIFAQYSYFWVLIYGLRTDFLHIPLIFIMPSVLERADIEKIGRYILYIAIPMTVLVLLQFKSPQGAWVNKQIGGADISGGLIGAAGRFRPSGTFSFVTGIAAFYPLATAFVLHFLLQKNSKGAWWLMLAGGSILLAMPFTISRLTVVSCAIVGICSVFVAYRLGKRNANFIRIILIVAIVAIVVPALPIFSEGKKVFNERWTTSTTEAGGIKTALVNRYVDSMSNPLVALFDAPLFGCGIGAGTNVGAKLISGRRTFLLAEGEWARVIYEMGPLLAIAFIAYRIMITWLLFRSSWDALARYDGLPFLLLSATVFLMVNGQWAQPTVLGFSIFGAGLTLSAAYRPPPLQL